MTSHIQKETFKAATNASKPQQQNGGVGTGLVAGGVGAAAVSALDGAGGTTVTTCPPGDTSFYCNFVKGFNIFKMILVMIGVLVLVGIIAYLFVNRKSPQKGRGGKKGK